MSPTGFTFQTNTRFSFLDISNYHSRRSTDRQGEAHEVKSLGVQYRLQIDREKGQATLSLNKPVNSATCACA
jgi:hypothetical protein